MKEIWKDVSGYVGYYKVSNFGRIKSFYFNKERILANGLDSNGYPFVVLTLNGEKITKKIHILVASAFLNHIPNGRKTVVNHINFDKTDNNIVNLELVTFRENSNRKHLPSTSKYVGVSWYSSGKKWRSQISINSIKKHLGYFDKEEDASNAYQKELLLLKDK